MPDDGRMDIRRKGCQGSQRTVQSKSKKVLTVNERPAVARKFCKFYIRNGQTSTMNLNLVKISANKMSNLK
jgi:hypothetical protein